MRLTTAIGKVRLDELEFPEDIPTGVYKLRVTDKTSSQICTPIPSIDCEFHIYPLGGDDKKKKKTK